MGFSVSTYASDEHRYVVNPRYTEAPLHSSSKTLRAAGTWTEKQQTELRVRQFDFIADQPEPKGGRDQGPSPMEYVAGGVNSCISVVVEQLAQRRGLPLTGISTYTLARQDTRGLAGQADVQPYFYAYRLQVVVETTQHQESLLADFVAEAERICPAVNLLRDAHIDLEVAWSFVPTLAQNHAEVLANRAWGYEVEEEAPTDETVFEGVSL